MKGQIFFVFIFVILFISNASSGYNKILKLEGRILSYDEKKVLMRTSRGVLVKFSKSKYFPRTIHWQKNPKRTVVFNIPAKEVVLVPERKKIIHLSGKTRPSKGK